jgi:hypothetical protein
MMEAVTFTLDFLNLGMNLFSRAYRREATISGTLFETIIGPESSEFDLTARKSPDLKTKVILILRIFHIVREQKILFVEQRKKTL